NVRYRDVGHTVPFITQFWMFASPVAYPLSLVPEKWRLLYSLNPMVGVIEGFRWALLGKQAPHFGVMAVSLGVVVALLVGGVLYFKHMERPFADVIKKFGSDERIRVMNDIAIRVEHLSKQYKIGVRRQRHNTLRDQLGESFKSLFRRQPRPSALHVEP